jgi:hypothetical protein
MDGTSLAWERAPWHATQRAAGWEALGERSETRIAATTSARRVGVRSEPLDDLAQGAAGDHRGASAVQPFASMHMRYSLASRLPSVPAPTPIGVPLAPTDIRGSSTQA